MKFGFLDLMAMYFGAMAGLKEAEKERLQKIDVDDSPYGLYIKSWKDFNKEDIDTIAKDAWTLSIYNSRKNKDGVFWPSKEDEKKIKKLLEKYKELKDKDDDVSKAKVRAVETLLEVIDTALVTMKDYIVLLEGILA